MAGTGFLNTQKSNEQTKPFRERADDGEGREHD